MGDAGHGPDWYKDWTHYINWSQAGRILFCFSRSDEYMIDIGTDLQDISLYAGIQQTFISTVEKFYKKTPTTPCTFTKWTFTEAIEGATIYSNFIRYTPEGIFWGICQEGDYIGPWLLEPIIDTFRWMELDDNGGMWTLGSYWVHGVMHSLMNFCFYGSPPNYDGGDFAYAEEPAFFDIEHYENTDEPFMVGGMSQLWRHSMIPPFHWYIGPEEDWTHVILAGLLSYYYKAPYGGLEEIVEIPCTPTLEWDTYKWAWTVQLEDLFKAYMPYTTYPTEFPPTINPEEAEGMYAKVRKNWIQWKCDYHWVQWPNGYVDTI